MTSLPFQFEEKLRAFRRDVARAHSAATKAFLFIEFVKIAFPEVGSDRAGYAECLLPELEEVGAISEGTIAVRGRIDILLSSLIIEFKTELNPISLHEAQQKLRRYVAALYSQNQRDYLVAASDGLSFNLYLPTVPLGKDVIANPGQVHLDQIDSLRLGTAEPQEAYLWLDRYLLAQELHTPTPEGFVSEFGISFLKSFVLPQLQSLWSKQKVHYHALYREWADYLSIICGTRVENEHLFLRHTYVATFARLMAYRIFSVGASPDLTLLQTVLSGKAFKEWGIINFVEGDLFSWLGHHQQGITIARVILQRLSKFNMGQMEQDILRDIYESTLEPKERLNLEQYYTPERIVQHMTYRLLEDDPRKSFLDPACGSGTFLMAAISHKLHHVALNPDDLLHHVLDSVVGIDIHPLAVTMAKTNYLLALSSLLRARSEMVTIPIYMADSLRPPQQTVINGVRVYQKIVDDKTSLYVPALNDPAIIDEIVDAIRHYAVDLAKNPESKDTVLTYFNATPRISGLFDSGELSQSLLSILQNTGQTLAKLIKDPQRGDTIWGFILRDFYKPILLLHRFNVVVGVSEVPPPVAFQ
jgi:SAM-dependent methyltransferase